jgi:hypothetical protein
MSSLPAQKVHPFFPENTNKNIAPQTGVDTGIYMSIFAFEHSLHYRRHRWKKKYAVHADFARFRNGRRRKASRAVSSETAGSEISNGSSSDAKEVLKTRLKCASALQPNGLPPV